MITQIDDDDPDYFHDAYSQLDQRNDARPLPRAAAKGGSVCERDTEHGRLGAASGVSWLDEQSLVMIADEVLGGWGRGTSSCCSFQPKCDVTRMLS